MFSSVPGEFFVCDAAKSESGTSCPVNCICTPCAAGQFSAAPAASCETCPTGKASIMGSTMCVLCPSGRYATLSADDDGGGVAVQVFAGAKLCNNCPAGLFAEYQSTVVCSRCSQGTISKSGDSSCSSCPAGTYSTTGASCAACAAGMYSGSGAQVCLKCQQPFFSRLAASSCKLCVKGSYFSQSGCVLCGEGTACISDGAATLVLLPILPGYWRIGANSSNVLPCPYGVSGCAGGIVAGDRGRGHCNQGYEGPLCAVCAQQYFRAGGACFSCKKSRTPRILGVVAAVVFICLSLCFVVIRFPTHVQRLREYADSLLSVQNRNVLKIIFVNCQILTVLPSVFDVSFTAPFSVLLGWLSKVALNFSNSSSTSVECYLRGTNFYSYLVSSTALPLSVCLVFLVSGRCLATFRESSKSWALFVVFVTLPLATVASCTIFDCKTFQNGSSFLVADYSLSCRTTRYNVFVIYSILMLIIWPIGMTCFFATILFQHRAVLSESQLTYRDQDRGIQYFRVLYAGYQRDLYFWELVATGRRLLYLGGLKLLPRGTILQISMAIFIELLSTSLFSHFWPFVSYSTNLLGLFADWVVFLEIFFSLIIKTSPTLSSGKNNIISVLLSFFTGLTLLTALILVSTRLREGKANEANVKVEWAVDFKEHKLVSTLSTVVNNSVARANVLLYFYSSLDLADSIIASGGFPPTESEGGIIFSLRGPHSLTAVDEEMAAFTGRGVVFCCSISRHLLRHLRGSLWLLPTDTLKAIGGHRAGASGLYTAFPPGTILFPVKCVARAFWLTDPAKHRVRRGQSSLRLLSKVRNHVKADDMFDQGRQYPRDAGLLQVRSSSVYVELMHRARKRCEEKNMLLVYHYTRSAFANSIINSGFRMSNTGQLYSNKR